MTAGMSRARRRVRVLGTLAVAASWSVVLVGAAQPAAADAQSKQWYLASMQAEDMWKVTTGEGVKVAVVDTGVNSSTPSLRGQVLKGVDVTGASGDETDDYRGHGTTMAELIAGTGRGGGLKGLAPGAEIIPVRMSDVDFMAKRNTVIGDIAKAIRAAADSDAQIISVSMGDVLSQREEHEAVKYAESKGKLVIAGVGNEGHKENWRQYPAAYPEVVGVASADRAGKVSYYSQHAGTVDVASPGSDIPSWCDNSFKSYCDGDGGTSAATAIASASAALVWSLHPDWTANQVLNVLFDTAGRDWKDGERSTYLGHGLIRPSMNVLKGKGDPGAPDISPLTEEKTTGPAKSSEPSSSTSPPPAENGAEGEKAAAVKESNSSDDESQLGLILGVAAAVAVLGGVAYAVVRRRKAA
ncbi:MULTISPECIES: S8 family serine peptidase [Streptomyces]|uniref:S8 family serine peptidase n=1 Tax=Streptomyces TaxID=1883 RepID=UPI0029B4D8A4|nr:MULTISPECIES: S8 family serine peptidase [unclassified Streptomyces]MDX3605377.1 S8 family serine peptidase [Streptomyces sp. FL06-04B]MDX3739961.1 S8 family serine peptidase [Streptomyces sp. ID01-15D]